MNTNEIIMIVLVLIAIGLFLQALYAARRYIVRNVEIDRIESVVWRNEAMLNSLFLYMLVDMKNRYIKEEKYEEAAQVNEIIEREIKRQKGD